MKQENRKQKELNGRARMNIIKCLWEMSQSAE